MLILSRRPGDAILIEGGIRLVVIACDRGGVRLGIEAPSDVSIVREEIATMVATENHRASTMPAAVELVRSLDPSLLPQREKTV